MELPANLSASTPKAGRRTFVQLVTYGLGAIATAALGLPVFGYLFGVRKAPIEWQSLGSVTDFPENQTRRVVFDNPIRQPWDGMVAKTGVYVRYLGRDTSEADERKSHRFLVLAANCAHLGCPVEWFQESGLFMCPCHGGVYYANGERASGPPTRGLYECVYRVRRSGGELQLDLQAPHFPTLQDTLNDLS
jgi:menaquinol-cytochrome c reductase iron-sulfur subunit